MKYYYKLITGFAPEDYIQIEESELDKANYCFLEKKDTVYSGGAVRGSLINSIKPDFHRIMGWNRGHKLDSFDYEELSDKGIDRECNNRIGESKNKVDYLIQTKQLHLLGKSVEGFEDKTNKKIEQNKGIKSIGDVIKDIDK